MGTFLILLMLSMQQGEAKATINPEAAKKFGPKWTSEIQAELNACAKTVSQLPARCNYPEEGNWMSQESGGMFSTKNGKIGCSWACKNPNPEPAKPKKKAPCDLDEIDGPFWLLEYGPWHLDMMSL